MDQAVELSEAGAAGQMVWLVLQKPTRLSPHCLYSIGSFAGAYLFCFCWSRRLSSIKVWNCRYWTQHCVRDANPYGRHLACLLRENYQAFPSKLCGEAVSTERNVYFCRWPSADRLRGIGDKMLETLSICEGNQISFEEGGPVPFCPMCNEARMDETTGVFITDFKSQLDRQRAPRRLEFAKRRGINILEGIEAVPPGFIQLEDSVTQADEFEAQDNDLRNPRPVGFRDESVQPDQRGLDSKAQEMDLDNAFEDGYRVAIQLDFENSNFARRYYGFVVILILTFLVTRGFAVRVPKQCPLEGAFCHPPATPGKFTPFLKIIEFFWRILDRLGP
eukprot:Selendium_serpulae@DN3024_c0_g1_i2.p1